MQPHYEHDEDASVSFSISRWPGIQIREEIATESNSNQRLVGYCFMMLFLRSRISENKSDHLHLNIRQRQSRFDNVPLQ